MRPTSLLLLLILTACASRADLGPAAPSQAFSSPAPLPATSTATPSRTPIPTATLTYRQAIDPYTIAGLRQRGYPGGTVTVLGVIEETKDFASTPASPLTWSTCWPPSRPSPKSTWRASACGATAWAAR